MRSAEARTTRIVFDTLYTAFYNCRSLDASSGSLVMRRSIPSTHDSTPRQMSRRVSLDPIGLLHAGAAWRFE